MKTNHKFEIGEIVFVKSGLMLGNRYENQDRSGGTYWSSSHKPYGGKFAVVACYNGGGYDLRFGAEYDTKNIYYDEMLETFIDTIKDGEGVTQDVEKLIRNIEIHNMQRCIDNALTSRMFETDRKGFQKLVDTYNELSKR